MLGVLATLAFVAALMVLGRTFLPPAAASASSGVLMVMGGTLALWYGERLFEAMWRIRRGQ